MTSKIQQARNEKLLKELSRYSENKRCAICTCMGTQFTCQPPGIFICSICAGAMTKSISMATYTTSEVQQMKEGGNTAFQRSYLAKWSAQSFPAPWDKDPKKVENFIKQVLVDKVFYSERTVEASATETARPTPEVVSQSLTQSSPPLESTWKAFPEENPISNSVQSSGTRIGGNWAEFSAATTPPVKTQTAPFDPFAKPSSPVHTSPKSLHSVPKDPFANQSSNKSWEPFHKPNQTATAVQPGWSQFESRPIDAVPEGRPTTDASLPTSPPNDGHKQKVPVMTPLPEELFSMGGFVEPQHTGVSYTQQDLTAVQQPPVHPFGAPQATFTPPVIYPQSNAFGNPQPSAFGPAPLGTSTPFHSTAAPTPWQPAPTQQPNQGYLTLQKQDSMLSYVSHRVDEASHNSLFQNLDMDMRAKAHSVTGVPIQTPPAYQSVQGGAPNFNRSGNSAFQQAFYPSQQTGFDEPTGNPFA